MKSEVIRDVLAIFMEGIFEELSVHHNDINFKIECSYLANIIDPCFKNFYGTLKNVQDIYFIPWDDESIVLTSMKEIARVKPDILSVEIEEDGYIKIYGNCLNGFTGGSLFFKADHIKIYTEEFETISHEALLELTDRFWYSGDRAGHIP
ncbi:hypothetical protein RCC89_11265 [Cytophagaceae bacterium ABcell3]|nr:hypothetical protein RCC89_11265 [Cytophagaceae bacterium ABcell3]